MSDITLRERAVGIADNVSVTVLDVSALREEWPNWEQWPAATRRRYTEAFAPVTSTATVHNVTCTALHQQVAALLNHRNDYDRVSDPPVEIAFGDDWGGGTSPDPSVFNTTDTSLNNRVGSISLTDPSNDGSEWRADENVASLELNGETLRELAVVTESGALWNHAPMPTEVSKTADDALILSIAIPISDVSP